MSKPIRLHFLRNDDLATRVKREEIKQIFEKKLIFGASFLKLHIILQVLQETDLLVQKVRTKAIIDGALPERMENLQLLEPKPSEAQNLYKNPQQTACR